MSRGLLIKLVHYPDEKNVTSLLAFAETVTFAMEELGKHQSGNAENKIQDPDALRITTTLLQELRQLKFKAMDQKVAELEGNRASAQVEPLVKAAVQNLLTAVNSVGIRWLKTVMSDPDSEDCQKVSLKANEILKPPTEKLQKALLTCTLVPQAPRMQEAMGAFSTEKGLGGLADMGSWYMQACTMDSALLESISSNTVEVLARFKTAFETHLNTMGAEFCKKVEQLKQLHGKYEQLGIC